MSSRSFVLALSQCIIICGCAVTHDSFSKSETRNQHTFHEAVDGILESNRKFPKDVVKIKSKLESEYRNGSGLGFENFSTGPVTIDNHAKNIYFSILREYCVRKSDVSNMMTASNYDEVKIDDLMDAPQGSLVEYKSKESHSSVYVLFSFTNSVSPACLHGISINLY